MKALMKETTITETTNGLSTSLPHEIATKINMADRKAEDRHRITSTVQCADGGIAIEFQLGPDVGGGETTVTPTVQESGVTRIRLPTFQGYAWHLDGCEGLAWPQPDEIDAEPDGSVTIRADVRGWEPRHEADLFGASSGVSYRTSIVESGDTRTNVEASFPIELAERVGLASSDARAEISFDCVDGRRVMVATPIDEDNRQNTPNSVSVNLAGNRQRAARFNAARIASEFGVRDRLATESVPLRWMAQDDRHLIAFLA